MGVGCRSSYVSTGYEVLAVAVPLSPEPLRDLSPIHHVPPRLHVVRAAVLVLEVVRVLPHVEPEERRRLALHDRVVLIGRADDGELVPVLHEPRPAGAEARGTGGV